MTSNSSFQVSESFEKLRKLGPGGTKLLSTDAVVKLLHLYSFSYFEGTGLRKLIGALKEDGCRIPADSPTLVQPDALPEPAREGYGRVTFATNWLFQRLGELRTTTESFDRLSAKEDEVRVLDIDGKEVRIGEGGACVDEAGSVLAPSKLTIQQLKAELMSRGLSTAGKRKDLYKRVQAARKSASPTLAQQRRKEEAKKKKAEDAKLRKMQDMLREQEENEREGKGAKKRGGDEGPRRKVMSFSGGVSRPCRHGRWSRTLPPLPPPPPPPADDETTKICSR